MKTTTSAQVALLFLVIAGFAWYQHDYRARFARMAELEQAARVREAESRRAQILDQLTITDIVLGTGAEAKEGTIVVLHYEVKIAGGKVFDSSYAKKAPVEFRLGAGAVIPGWDIGIQGMRVGGKRAIVVPPEFGYGTSGTRDKLVPPNATLSFVVELLEVK